MAADYSKSKKKPIGKMVLFGICSAIILWSVTLIPGSHYGIFHKRCIVCCSADCRQPLLYLTYTVIYRLFLVCFRCRSEEECCGEAEAGG